MTYQEFRNTYKQLLKYAPAVSSLYGDEAKKDITATIKHYEKKSGKWAETESTIEKVNFVYYCNTVDPNASKFFKSLGGYEKTTKAYTKAGYIPVECVSINPNRTKKTVRTFEF